MSSFPHYLLMCFWPIKISIPPPWTPFAFSAFSALILWWALFAGYDPKCSLFASGPPLILISFLATDVGSVHYSSWDSLGGFLFAFACWFVRLSVSSLCSHLLVVFTAGRCAPRRFAAGHARCTCVWDLTHCCEYLIHVCQKQVVVPFSKFALGSVVLCADRHGGEQSRIK